jgi:membrane-bound lytic murein transglycosylase B
MRPQAAAAAFQPTSQPAGAVSSAHKSSASSGGGGSDLLSDLRHAMAFLDVERQQPAAMAAAAHTDSDDESISDVFDDVAPAQPTGSLLQQVARDIAALNSRNATLQQEIDGMSVTSSSLPSPRPQPAARAAAWQAAPQLQQQQQQQRVGTGKQATASHTLLPPTPDLSQT